MSRRSKIMLIAIVIAAGGAIIAGVLNLYVGGKDSITKNTASNTKPKNTKQYTNAAIASITHVGTAPTQDVRLANGTYTKAIAGQILAKINDQDTVASFGGTIAPMPYLKDTYKISVKPGADLLKISGDIAKKRGVVYAQPNYVVQGNAVARDIPNDPWLGAEGDQDHLVEISAPEAWAVSVNGAPIAVVDTGANPNEIDLQAKLLPGQNFVAGGNPSNTVDDEIEDGALPGNGHGTIVALTAAGRGNNGKEGVGVSRGSSVMPVKVLDSNKNGDEGTTAQGVAYATSKGIRVINLSISGPQCPNFATDCTAPVLKDAINGAIDANSVVVISSGNASKNAQFIPASNPRAVVVGALINQDTVARVSYSNYGPNITLSAPGAVLVNLTSSGGSSTLTQGNGTSFAAPQVAGAVAMMLALKPSLTPDKVKAILSATADGPASAQVGAGRLNVYRAIKYTKDCI